MATTITTAYHILAEEKINQSDNVSGLPGLLLQVILPVHGVDDHKLILLVVSQIANIKKSRFTQHHNNISRPW